MADVHCTCIKTVKIPKFQRLVIKRFKGISKQTRKGVRCILRNHNML